MKALKILSFVLIFLSIQNGYTQIVPQISWQRDFGGTGNEYVRSGFQTSDGGYFLAGDSNSGIGGDKLESSMGGTDYWVVKLNVNGVIEWQNTIGGGGTDNLYAALQTADGGYILAGNSTSLNSGDKTEIGNGSTDLWIIKLNASGNIIWQNTIGGSDNDYMVDIALTDDGGYFVLSRSFSDISGDKSQMSFESFDYWVLKLNSTGGIVWQSTLGTENNDYPTKVVKTDDGGCLLGGYTNGGISGIKTEASIGSHDYWILKLDASGNLLWQNTIGAFGADMLTVMIALPGGNFLLGGNSSSVNSGDKSEYSFNNDLWVIKINASGSILWENTIIGSNEDYLYAINSTADGGFILGASSNSNLNYDKSENLYYSYDYWVIKLNSGGVIQWDNTIGGNNIDYIYGINQCTDLGFFVCGYSNSSIQHDKIINTKGLYDFWVMKLEAEGLVHTYYADTDLDGFGNILSSTTGLVAPTGYIPDNTDCNDSNPIIFPGSIEICNAIDDNCNGIIDDGLIFKTYYQDLDDDGFGNSLISISSCGPPIGYTLKPADCNEFNPNINPGAPEVGNMVDDNCDGIIETETDFIWQNVIGGPAWDGLTSMDVTLDGGYILGGSSYSEPGGDKTEPHIYDKDFWVVKISATGTIEWDKTIGSNGYDDLTSVISCADGGYLIAGNSDGIVSGDKTEATHGLDDLWIVKLNNDGTIQWQNTIGASSDDYPWKVAQTSDGGFLVGADTKSGLNGDKTEGSMGSTDLWIMKLDALGNIIWQNVVGGSSTDNGYDFKINPDGSFVVGASSYSNISGDKTENNLISADLWIIKFTSTGSIVWQNTITGGSTDIVSGIDATTDGGFIVGAYSSSNNFGGDKTEPANGLNDFWILKLNASGNIIWQNSIGGSGDEILTDIEVLDDGTIAVAGYSSSGVSFDKTEASMGGMDMWLLQLNNTGELIYQNSIGNTGDDYLKDIIETSDDAILLGGYSNSPIGGDMIENPIATSDYWVYKYDIAPALCILPTTISPSGTATFCAGSSVLLSAPEDPSYIYQWRRNGINIGGGLGTSSTYTASLPGYYSVLINDGICSAESDTTQVIKSPAPAATISNLDPTNDLCFDTSIKLKANGGPGYSWQWYKGATALTGATAQIYFANSIGNYKVKVYNAAGCPKTSSPYTIIKTCRLENNEQNDISIFPNPTSGDFSINQSYFEGTLQKHVIIKNIIGETVLDNYYTDSEQIQIHFDQAPSTGLYIVVVGDGENMIVKNIWIGK